MAELQTLGDLRRLLASLADVPNDTPLSARAYRFSKQLSPIIDGGQLAASPVFNQDNGELISVAVSVAAAAPSDSQWAELLQNMPHEDVELDEHGHYDPKKAPDFHEWMEDG